MVGIDLSAYMLDRCREAAAKENIEPRLIQADMRELDFTAEFDAVINMWTSFGYLESEEEDHKALDGLSRALKPGGRFLIDLMNRDWLMKNFRERDWEENSRGCIMLSDRRFDSVTGRINAREITLHPDGRRKEISHSLRLYTYRELEEMLKKAELTIESVWGGFDSRPFTSTSNRMTVIATRTR